MIFHLSENRIELIPLETIEKVFTEEEYKKLDMLSVKEKGKEKLITKKSLIISGNHNQIKQFLANI